MKLVYGRPTPAALAAYARCLDIFKFFISVCPIFPNILSLSSETVRNDLNMVDWPLNHKSINQYIIGGRLLESFSIVLMTNYNFVNNEYWNLLWNIHVKSADYANVLNSKWPFNTVHFNSVGTYARRRKFRAFSSRMKFLWCIRTVQKCHILK